MEKRGGAGKKIFWTLFLIALIVVVILFGAKIFLYIKLLIGKDVIINLVPEKENIFLSHQESEEVNIKISALANLFCEVKCDYSFTDISENNLYEKSSFTIKITDSITKSYTITAPNKGKGQKMYRFDADCITIKTYLCRTENKTHQNSLLVTMNYNLSEDENKIKEKLENNYYLYVNKTNNLNKTLLIIEENKKRLDEKVLGSSVQNINELIETNKKLDAKLEEIKILWEKEEISEVTNELDKMQITIKSQENKTTELNKTIENQIYEYNYIISNITKTELELKTYKTLNFTQGTSEELNRIIGNFNALKIFLKQKNFLVNQKKEFLAFYKNYTRTKNILEQERKNDVEKNYSATVKIDNSTFKEIQKIANLTFTFKEYKLKKQEPQCCLFKECYDCCNESCSSEPSKYPVIFLHGHDFMSSMSSKKSLETFEEMQRKLEEDNYSINAGSMIINTPEGTINGIWGENQKPISVKSSYYFDTLINQTSLSILQAREDGIDTYAIRLRDIIGTVKYKTNRDKVIIVAHSMGGLVTRRYIQLFGEDDVEKIILIGTPNHGVDETSLTICKIFGEKQECEDMSENSLMINKLNNQKKPSIDIYNIIGVGCETNGKPGDGIVTNSSAYLEWAQNYYITRCNASSSYMHTKMVSPYEYPEIYERIKLILKESS